MDDGSDDATNELEDFVVGVEDLWELPANNLIRFRDVEKSGRTFLPDAALTRATPISARNRSSVTTRDIHNITRGFDSHHLADRATLVTFCETPTSDLKPDVARGFVFDVSDDAPDDDALLGEIFFEASETIAVSSDATAAPDGAHALFLYHCYTYPGLEGTRARATITRRPAAPIERLRNLGVTVDARLLVKWSGAEVPDDKHGGDTRVRGGAEADGDDRGVDVIRVG